MDIWGSRFPTYEHTASSSTCINSSQMLFLLLHVRICCAWASTTQQAAVRAFLSLFSLENGSSSQCPDPGSDAEGASHCPFLQEHISSHPHTDSKNVMFPNKLQSTHSKHICMYKTCLNAFPQNFGFYFNFLWKYT